MGSAELPAACIVQARTGSTRLPGKVLEPIDGRPALAFLLERLARLTWAHLVVATTTEARDDPVADLAGEHGAGVCRGSEQDVLGRYVTALDRFPAAHVVRITADCPLTDPALVRSVVEHHLARHLDYTCNVLPHTFPRGLDVEVMTAESLRTADREATLPSEREHVTPFLYRHPERFRLGAVRSGADLGDVRWTVDTPEDLAAVRSLVRRVGGGTTFGWRDLLAVADPPHRPPGQLRLRPATAQDADAILAWRNDPVSVATSGTGRAVDPTEHERWFAAALEDPGRRIHVVERDATPLGMVRVDVEDARGTVSIAVASEQRGAGVGTAALGLLTAATAGDPGIDALDAHVRVGNERSLRAFRSAGFRELGTTQGWTTLRWQNPAVPVQEGSTR